VTDQAAEVTGPVANDPEPESTPNEAHDGLLVADTAPVDTSPVSQGHGRPGRPDIGP